ncbi:uncharacterized protein LOC135159863 [Diachasmimorpha longicaudata]|uniref:uncharacterized protein LOC135159863 n=1 Tax=Diachasmimorpha longicaudata TaxID=58733 RepID=UPI0030B878D1
MIFKVLCLTLLACALAQAAPQYTITIPDPMDVIRNIGSAAAETTEEVKNSFRTKLDAWLDAGKAIFDAGVESVDTSVTVVKSPFRFGSKVWDKTVNDDSLNLNEFKGLKLE